MKLEVEKELQDLGSQLQQTEIVAKESIQSLNIEEDSVKELEAKNMEIDSKALELENNLKKLSERKSELEHEVTSITTKLSRLKHNRQLSTARFEVDMFKEMQCSMEINSKLALTEERFYKHQSMKFTNLLKELCESLEIQVSRNFSILQKMIHLYAVMKVICVIETMSDNPIITIYAEKQLDLFEDMKTIMRKTAPDDVVNATLTRVHQMRPMLLFFSKLFDHDCMKYHTGTWRQSLDNLDELKHANVKFKYVEKRLISILDALLEKTHLDVKSIFSQHDDYHNDSTICSCLDPLLHDNMHSLDGEKTKEIFSKMINLGEPDETCLETVFKEIQLHAKKVLETYFLNDTSNNKLLSKMEKISKFICDKENLDIAQEDEKLKRKVAMIKKEKERSSEMQRKLEIIEKKNSNQDMSLSPAAVSREPGQATSLPFIKLDEKTAEIVDEERKIKQKTSTFSPSSLLSKFESRKSPQN
ncbi:hypothetical protein C9374_005402 [Naegleria lovaniensis]|uniref:Uncharacterized protein n=1 Tax=Naegleria lovaniensis TaxID=51637 RepID=A0AA88GQG0_NAELO|nr:uncharacterized protein C9374_005402 [Naegleria lovaniensis]KAG2382200.1 hypothetical protein C9374_005402 [Naegleria lovaniensis]